MNIWRKILFALGVSMLIAITAGFITSETKYFYLTPGKDKTEITKNNYDAYFDKSITWAGDFAKFTSKENVFNIQSSIIAGLTTFSIFLILISIVNKNPSKLE